MSKKLCSIVWFRQDLRLSDNPALAIAVKQGAVLPIYILDDVNAGTAGMGAASRVWLHHSLELLNRSLDGKLRLFHGNAIAIIKRLTDAYDVSSVCWNRCYEPWRIARDAIIKTDLKSKNITVHSCNGSLLWEPWTVLKKDATPYKVFTPYYQRGCLSAPPPGQPVPAPKKVDCFEERVESS